MARIISVCNQKGGVGKTTTTINFGASLAATERKTLLIDFDSQANSTSGLGLDKANQDKNSYRVVLGEIGAKDAVQKTNISYLDVIPSTIDLVAAEVELIDQPGREFRLRDALKDLDDQYDFILIDCPPSLGFLTINALVASHSVIIPVQCEYYALEGMTDLMNTIRHIREKLNPKLQLEGILLTMYDGRTNLSHQVEEEIRQHFHNKVFNAFIPRNVRLSEAPSHGKPVITYDYRSKGAQCYLELAREFLEHHASRATTGVSAEEVNRGAA